MIHDTIPLPMPDGVCTLHIFTPDRTGRHPAILFYMDAGGLRPTVIAMARRLSDAGFVVLLPDLFYRYGPYGPFDPVEVLKGDVGAILGPLMATTGNAGAAQDTDLFLAYLDERADVASDRIGAVGFCMGGGMAIAAAGRHPDRFAAVASFHGGNLATEAADSPHRAAAALKAELYVAAAQDDDSYTDRQYDVLAKADGGPAPKRAETPEALSDLVDGIRSFITDADARAAEIGSRAGMGTKSAATFLKPSAWKTDDAAWFASRPDRSHRLRPLLEAELETLPDAIRTSPMPEGHELQVLVRQVEPGARVRTFFGRNLAVPIADEEAVIHALFDLVSQRPPGAAPDLDARTLKAMADSYRKTDRGPLS